MFGSAPPGLADEGVRQHTRGRVVPNTLLNRDFARFDFFRLGQTQSQNALLDFGVDLRSVDGWIEFERAPIIGLATFRIDHFRADRLFMTMADDREFISFQRN